MFQWRMNAWAIWLVYLATSVRYQAGAASVLMVDLLPGQLVLVTMLFDAADRGQLDARSAQGCQHRRQGQLTLGEAAVLAVEPEAAIVQDHDTQLHASLLSSTPCAPPDTTRPAAPP